MGDTTKVLNYRVHMDSRDAISNVIDYKQAIQSLGQMTTAQVRAARGYAIVKQSETRASREQAVQLKLEAQAQAALALANDRNTNTAIKNTRQRTSEEQKAERDRAKAKRDKIKADKEEEAEIAKIIDANKALKASADAVEREWQEMTNGGVKSLERIQVALEKVRAEQDKLAKSGGKVDMSKITPGLTTIGNVMTAGLTAPIVALGHYSLSKAIDWEAAFAEVEKFTNGSREELTKLRSDLRALALDAKIGLSFPELANIAAVGGQMGLATKDIAGFTRQVGLLMQTSELGGEEAASSLSKIKNALGLNADAFPRITSALAEMGAIGSSTVGEIVAVTERMAGAGRIAGLTAPQIMAMANVVVSMGQKSEAAGTSMQRLIIQIASAVGKGGQKLDEFARVSGVSAKQFAEMFHKEPEKAIQAFADGLAKLPPKSDALIRSLDALGIKSVREFQAVVNLATGHNLLSDAMKKAQEAYDNQSAAEDRAAIAAKTTKRQLEILQHQLDDDANTLGQSLIPALQDAIKNTKPLQDGVKNLADAFHKMGPEAQQAWTNAALITASAGPIILGIAKVAEAVGKLKDMYLALQAAAAGGGLKGAGATAGGVIAAGIVGWGIGTGIDSAWQYGTKGKYDDERGKTNEDTAEMDAKRGPAYQAYINNKRSLDRYRAEEARLKYEADHVIVGSRGGRVRIQDAGAAAELLKVQQIIGVLEQRTEANRQAAVKVVTDKMNPKPTKTPPPGGGDGGNTIDDKTAADIAGAAEEQAKAALKAKQDAYSKELKKLKDATPDDIPAIKKRVAQLSSDILSAAEEAARAEFAKEKGSKNFAPRTAAAKQSSAIGEAITQAGDRNTEIDAAAQEAWKRGRAAASERANQERADKIESAKRVANVTKQVIDDSLTEIKSKGLKTEDESAFRKTISDAALTVLRKQKETADLEYRQTVATDPSKEKSARIAQANAYDQAQRAYEKTLKTGGDLDDAVKAGKGKVSAQEDAYLKSANREYAERTAALNAYIEAEIKHLEALQAMTSEQTRTLADIDRQKQLADEIYQRQSEKAGASLEEFKFAMSNPALGIDPEESFQRYQEQMDAADSARRRTQAGIAQGESGIRVTGAHNQLLDAAFYGRTSRDRRNALSYANQGYETARNLPGLSPEERDRITMRQAQDTADAATAAGSKLNLKDALQQEETLRADALRDGNRELAKQIEEIMERLHSKARDQWSEIENRITGSLSNGANRAVDALVDNIGKGGNAKKALQNVGIDTGKDIVKGMAQSGLKNLGDEIGKAISRAAGDSLKNVSPQLGLAFGFAAAGALTIATSSGKKRRNSLLGGILDVGIVAALGGGIPAILGGFGLGAQIGGMFADGGTAPGRKVSLFGERGPELGIPESDMRILPADITAQLLGGGSRGGGVTINNFGPGIHVENVHDAAALGAARKDYVDNVEDRFTAAGSS